MIVGVGIDLVQNSRIRKALQLHEFKFLKKILTEEERDRQKHPRSISIPHLAGIFAAKEAAIKSLSQYLGFPLNFQEIIVKSDNDIPKIEIKSDRAKNKLSKVKISISISHEKNYSAAFAIAEIN